jgi:hypothetical protein
MIQNLEQKVNELYHTPSDINEHFPAIIEYGSKCETITEMGVRWVVSTWAWLACAPKKLRCYDLYDPSHWGASIQDIKDTAEAYNLDFKFEVADVLKLEIEETDLLFIDTWHDYQQLKSELYRHSEKVRKYIILHDTLSFGFTNERIYETYDDERLETNLPTGLNVAIDEFLFSNKKWYIHERFAHNNGLTILKRL